MQNLVNKTIAIVGGGPGGLTLARLLQVKGVNVKVYERDESRNVRVQGATLDLHEESGLLALEKGGLMDAFKANYRAGADKMRLTDKAGNILYDEHETGKDSMFRPEIDRGPLRDILLDSLKPGTVIWNSQFTQMAPHDDGWQLHFKNGTTATADIVIAADGANSKIRPYITPVKAFYSGYTVVEGSVYNAATAAPVIHALVKGGKVFALGDAKTLILSAKGDGSVVFYTGCRTSEDWVTTSGVDFTNAAQLKAWFKQAFAGWSDSWLELFDNATNVIPRPQYCMPLDQTWNALPNLTMLGDAAHLMPPYAGEGVNMAMLDALELSDNLTDNSFADVQSAIAAYEKQMRARASETAKMTLEQTESMHSANGLQDMLEMFTGG